MNRSALRLCVIAASLCIAGTGFAAGINPNRSGGELRPDGKGQGFSEEGTTTSEIRAAARAVVGTNGINYHGGPVMTGTTNVYYIWYGNWTGNSATTTLTTLMQSFTGSAIYNTNTTYYNSANVHVLNSVNFVQSTTDNYSLGKRLSDANIQSVVASAISSGRLPKDTNGVYFVLTSSDVAETSGFGSVYCGWHTRGTISGSDIKYAFVGDATTIAPTGCIAVTAAQSPNSNKGADGMASVIFHELSETVSDPDLNAWYDRRGNENGDKCAWKFGTTYTAANGGIANVRLGSRDFLLQEMWVNASGGYCSLSF